MNNYFMSVDLGTSSVRAFIADFEKHFYFSESEEYGVEIPKTGYAEQNPLTWYQKTVSAIRKVLKNSSVNPREIKALSFSGQMHGLVSLDENHNPVMNAVIWLDQRSDEVLKEIYDLVGESEITAETQNRISAGFMIGSLYWLKKNLPSVYEKIQHVMLPKDYIKYRLSGIIATDYSDAAGTSAFNNFKLQWSFQIIEKLGLNKNLFPDCFESAKIIGNITTEAAKDTGLTENTLIINGGGDSFMQAVGNGIVTEGLISSNIGTAAQISTTIKSPVFDPKLRTSTFAHVIPDCLHLTAACLNGGIALKWITKQILNENDYETVNNNILKSSAGCNGLLFLPYLAGERTPHMNPKARGIFFGLTLNHGRAEIERSVMEGVTFALKDCLNIMLELGVKCDKIIASGGGAKSDIWLQIQADIFERDVYRSASVEQASLGAAITAAVGAEYFGDFETACGKCVDKPLKVFRPDDKNFGIYRNSYSLFKDIYLRNREIFERINIQEVNK